MRASRWLELKLTVPRLRATQLVFGPYSRFLVNFRVMGPDTATIGSEFLNALTNVEQGSGNPATAWDDAVNNIRTAIGE